MSQEFDQYSGNYRDLMEDATKSTGYDFEHFFHAKLKKLQQLNPEQINREFSFLDYGCGAGNLFRFFPDYFPKGNYTGVDASPEMIVQAKTSFPETNFIDLASSEWSEKGYDLIFAAGVFHHIPHEEHANILTRLSERLLPSGKLIIWEHNPINPFTRKVVRDCEFDRDAVLVPSSQMMERLNGLNLAHTRLVYTTFFPKSLSFLLPLERWLEWFPLGGQYVAIAENA